PVARRAVRPRGTAELHLRRPQARHPCPPAADHERPWRSRKLASRNIHSCKRSPPRPSGCSRVWSGPATKPSSDIEISTKTCAIDASRLKRYSTAANLSRMCRNIQTLYNFEPPATGEEVRNAALQYVRKISGFTKPSQANAEAFEDAVDEIAEASARLLSRLVTSAPPKDRELEAAKRRARSAQRFAA